ncbi:FAD-dependent monooxygenase [Mycobacterium sp. NAZ190054]|uniref:FAD-dependent monooxygenase n=1 Tax=Mycobacterium sp. NAZ190054 TaxID=1747766 RepID=UPI000797BB42|nr:FAD-dependent monooxygenase [Mycobacterium sp. NAZ190054]KWX66216.1 fumarate reductase [Mycobacterium sp. NAZ190054]
MSAAASRPIRVLVVGAGIGGLSAACTLRDQGLDVTVLEQAPELGEVGTGLQIGPNASRIILRLGLAEQINPYVLVTQESVRRRWEDGSLLARTELGDSAIADFGAPYWHLHRADLHTVLHRAATDPDRPGRPAAVHTDSRVVEVDDSDPARPAVITADGRRYDADVLIGADGIKSVLRSAVDAPTEILRSGDMAYRTLIRGDRVAADPRTAWLLDRPAANFWLGHDHHIVVYPIRGFTAVNVVAIVPARPEVDAAGRTEEPAEALRDAYAGWDETVGALLAQSEDTVIGWALHYQDPHTNWVKGPVALLGDACHAMLPYFSQGASQAIEDAAVLAEELGAIDRDGIPAALLRYQDRRAEHAGVVQKGALGNRALFHLPDGPEQRARDARFKAKHAESDVTFDWIYRGTPLAGDLEPTPDHLVKGRP